MSAVMSAVLEVIHHVLHDRRTGTAQPLTVSFCPGQCRLMDIAAAAKHSGRTEQLLQRSLLEELKVLPEVIYVAKIMLYSYKNAACSFAC